MHHAKPTRFKLIIEGETMSSVTGTYTITVAPSTASTLAINPPNGSESETVGTAASGVVATVSGGTPPYTYAVTGLPAGTGLSLVENPSADGNAGDADVSLTGTPNAADAAASPISLVIVVTDSAPTPATARRTISVGK
jgi:hypothetical protein